MSMGSVAQCLLQRERVCGTFGAAQDGATEEDRKTGGQRTGTQGRSVIDRSLEGAIRHCGSL
jgi:hypothetical protein